MIRKLLFIFSFFAAALQVEAQPALSAQQRQVLRAKEDSLKTLAKSLIVDSLTAGRMRNDSLFVRTLIRSLQVKHSFFYPFDSVQGIGKVYAPDSSFRIFSWTLSFDDFYSRQRAAIQFRTPDGSLKLVPLRDYSEFTEKPHDSLRTKDNWIGAVYYNIIKTAHNGKPYYTLFGFDDNNVRSNKKWIDVMHLDEKGMPVFGGAPFSFERDSAKRAPQQRYSIEYKKEASALVNYDPDLNVILVDHLVSESEEDDKPYTFIPDGDYEGFKWENGKWVHINKVFTEKLLDGQAPVPDPILDAGGNRNDAKLQQQSEKNKVRKGKQ
ncbi:hypothetical protein SAMN05444008_11930 [Cnuella takakiae]|uniref:Outer membrane lipoprotein-sorting protein n=1 Tax=Cnuella takakiae TaxID=1302690 RepID=A0A1M5HFB8_9BACT|nr:hypothetical protein [Cnuella takakiae]OLY92848.1 hypothetical protein BUE76_13850 [Cnuella takakiae]SHG14522.1 hypothetical protein SAMN05444008_11930 [Cnuella takakiae]